MTRARIGNARSPNRLTPTGRPTITVLPNAAAMASAVTSLGGRLRMKMAISDTAAQITAAGRKKAAASPSGATSSGAAMTMVRNSSAGIARRR